MNKMMTIAMIVGLTAGIALASDFRPIRRMDNPRLQGLVEAMKAFGGDYAATGTYRVTRPTEARGRTPGQLREAIVKEALHRYSGAYLDDGVGLREVFHSARGARFAVESLQEFEQNEERPWKRLEGALRSALEDRTLDVTVGSGSGNNTIAAMLCVYDIESDQVAFLILSNFGSDS